MEKSEAVYLLQKHKLNTLLEKHLLGSSSSCIIFFFFEEQRKKNHFKTDGPSFNTCVNVMFHNNDKDLEFRCFLYECNLLRATRFEPCTFFEKVSRDERLELKIPGDFDSDKFFIITIESTNIFYECCSKRFDKQ